MGSCFKEIGWIEPTTPEEESKAIGHCQDHAKDPDELEMFLDMLGLK